MFKKMMRILNKALRVLGLGVCTWRCVHKYPKLFKRSHREPSSVCNPCYEDLLGGEDRWDPWYDYVEHVTASCVYWGDVPVPKSKEAYEIWCDQMGYADSEETGPSYEEWLIHKAEQEDWPHIALHEVREGWFRCAFFVHLNGKWKIQANGKMLSRDKSVAREEALAWAEKEGLEFRNIERLDETKCPKHTQCYKGDGVHCPLCIEDMPF